jgi:xylulokinase
VTYLGLDLGTGSVKAMVVDEAGAVLESTIAPYSHELEAPGEADPEGWWAAAVRACRTAVVPELAGSIRGIGVSGQMHGVVMTRSNGSAVRPAITWADQRPVREAAAFNRLPAEMLKRLGNPPAPGMAGPILLWLRDHDPVCLAEADWALQPKDWLRLRLTHSALADPSDASATLLYDIPRDDWAFDLAEELGLPASLLAPLAESDSIAGELSSEAADALGLAAGTPVAVGAADTASALYAAGLASGEVLLNVGSGGQVVEPTSAPALHPRRLTHAFRGAGKDRWYAMAAVLNAGVALEWAIRILQSSWTEVYDVALPQTDPGANGLFFLPYLVGERGDRSLFTGSWVGLRAEHDRRHLLRAALEGVAFSLRSAVELLEDTPGRYKTVCLAGGSTRWPAWRSLLADVLGRRIDVIGTRAASAAGAARLAAQALGETLPPMEGTSPTVRPTPLRDFYDERYPRFVQLVRSTALDG